MINVMYCTRHSLTDSLESSGHGVDVLPGGCLLHVQVVEDHGRAQSLAGEESVRAGREELLTCPEGRRGPSPCLETVPAST